MGGGKSFIKREIRVRIGYLYHFILKPTNILCISGYERAGTVHCNSVQGGHRFGARIEANSGADAELSYRIGGGSSSTSPSTERSRKAVKWTGGNKATL